MRCFLTDVKRGVIKDEKEVPCSFDTDPYEVYEANIKSNKKTKGTVLSWPFVFVEEEY